jgi:hypothetical protein
MYTYDVEMISLTSSNEIKPHFTDFLRIYNNEGFIKMMEYINTKRNSYSNLYNLIVDIEVNSIDLFESKCCLYHSDEQFKGNIHFDDENCYNYIYNLNYPIVKLKKITTYCYIYQDFPEDFDEDVYKSMNYDLQTITDLKQHFLNHGMSEGRRYKSEQGIKPPNYIVEYLNNYIENNRNICFYETI